MEELVPAGVRARPANCWALLSVIVEYTVEPPLPPLHADEDLDVAALVRATPDDTPGPREAAARSESDVISPGAPRSLSDWYVR